MKTLDISIRSRYSNASCAEWIWIVKQTNSLDGKTDEYASRYPLPYPYLAAIDLAEFLKTLESNSGV